MENKVQFLNTTHQQLAGTFHDASSDKVRPTWPPHKRAHAAHVGVGAGSTSGPLLLLQVVILCHGYASSKDGFVFPKMAKALAAKKLSSLRFDFTGNGESDGAFEFGNYLQEARPQRWRCVCTGWRLALAA